MTSSERIGLLMFRYVRKKLSAAEEKELAAWRYTHPDNEPFFLSTTDPEYIRHAINGIYDTKEIVYNRLLEKFPGRFPNPIIIIKKQPKVYQVLRFAATVAVVLGFSLYILSHRKIIQTEDLLSGTNQVGFYNEKGIAVAMNDFNRGWLTGRAGITLESNGKGDYIYHASSKDHAAADLYYKLYTASNGQLDLRLPDGFRIFLNGNSTIRYPRNLSQDSLKIFLEGEAWLELPKTKHHVLIFIKNTRIDVAGAQLDVEAYPGDSVNRITMVAGNAKLVFNPEHNPQQNIVHLDAKREAISSAGKIEIMEASDTSETFSWKNGRIHFTKASIQTIMRSIEHGYGVHVEYKGKISNQKFSVDLPRETRLGMVLLRLESQGLRYSIKKNTIIIQ
jgi:transmembrane sensor